VRYLLEIICVWVVLTLLYQLKISRNLKIKIYENLILPVPLYVCETWYFTLREEHRLKMFENRMLRRTF
jgi:hypothetical protein